MATLSDGKRYERLKAWQACHELVLGVYRHTGSWPPEERYSLVQQARRASFSAAANMAEGAARKGTREFRRFLQISLGSLSELAYIFRLAKDLGYMSSAEYGGLEALRGHAGRLTWGLYNSPRLKG